MWAVSSFGSIEVCELLLSSGADVNHANAEESVLFRAISRLSWHDQETKVELLLRAGADVHYVDADGRTALHLAVITASSRICELLLDHGTAIDARDHGGMYAIMSAVQISHHQALELLIRRGARLDAVF